MQEVAKLVGDLVGIEDRADHAGDPVGRQGREVDDQGGLGAPPSLDVVRQRVLAVQLVSAISAEQHDAGAAQAPRQVVEQLAGRRVRPMQVLEDEQQSRLLRREAQQGQDRFEQAQLGLRRITRLARFGFRLQLRKEVGELSPKRTEPFAYLVQVDRGQVVAERLEKR